MIGNSLGSDRLDEHQSKNVAVAGRSELSP